LGPAEDGGYYLLGLSNHIPEIFHEIQWSTGRVLNQTLERIKEKKLYTNSVIRTISIYSIL